MKRIALAALLLPGCVHQSKPNPTFNKRPDVVIHEKVYDAAHYTD